MGMPEVARALVRDLFQPGAHGSYRSTRNVSLRTVIEASSFWLSNVKRSRSDASRRLSRCLNELFNGCAQPGCDSVATPNNSETTLAALRWLHVRQGSQDTLQLA